MFCRAAIRIIPFTIAFTISLFLVGALDSWFLPPAEFRMAGSDGGVVQPVDQVKCFEYREGWGFAACSGSSDSDSDAYLKRGPAVSGPNSPLRILSKPQAKFTDRARTNGVQGAVRLKVVLLASKRVGSITPVTKLPDGLTEQAIAAARKLKFEPARVNGVPVSKTITIDYSFTIY